MAKLKDTSISGDLSATGKITSTVAGASTTTIGTVKLNSATNSTSTTEAATPSAVKAAYDLANGKANASHGNHVPGTQTVNDAVYLRNDNTWQTITPAKIGAAERSHTHNSISTNSVDSWNTAHTNGFWQGESKEGAPEPSGWFWGYRVQHSGGYGAQMLIKNGGNRLYFRSQDADGSGTWNNVYHTNHKPSPADIGAATSGHSHSNATTSAHGFMSNADKSKLDGIATGANAYVHPGSGTNPHGTTKSDVGLSSVNNWGASSSISANSTSQYATTNMVAQVRAEKASISGGKKIFCQTATPTATSTGDIWISW